MENNGPRKVGEYEQPARTSSVVGRVIGGLVLIALIVLAILFFSSRHGSAAPLSAGGGHAVSTFSHSAGQAWLVWDRGAQVPHTPSDPGCEKARMTRLNTTEYNELSGGLP